MREAHSVTMASASKIIAHVVRKKGCTNKIKTRHTTSCLIHITSICIELSYTYLVRWYVVGSYTCLLDIMAFESEPCESEVDS